MPYKLPSQIPPLAYRCIKIWIPDDPEWSSVFWGQFHQLVHWWTHERDEEQKAAQVGTVWRDLFAQAREAYENDETCGGDELTDIRLRKKPGVPWVSQFSHDAGETWVDFLEQANWGTRLTVPPTDGDALTAQRQAGTIIRGWHEWIAGSILDSVTAGLTRAQALDSITGQVAPFHPNPSAFRDAVGQVYDEMTDLPTPTAEPYRGDCVYRETWQELAEKLKSHTFDWLNDINNANMWATDTEGMNEVGRLLNMTSMGLAMQDIFHFAQSKINPNDPEFMSECEWLHVLNFTALDYGFEGCCSNEAAECPEAVWNSGIGWTDGGACAEPPGNPGVEAVIKRAIPPGSQITRIEYEPTFTAPSATEGYGIQINGSGDCQVNVSTGGVVWDADDFEECLPITEIKFYASNAAYSGIIIAQATVEGTGWDPFL